MGEAAVTATVRAEEASGDPSLALLTVKQMAAADAASISAGVSGKSLMAAAGNAVFVAIVNRFPPQPTVVLCGPGNNGGDGYVVAERLRRAGWPVTVASLVDTGSLHGDAAWAASCWQGPVAALDGPGCLDGRSLAIDAIFGAGLARPVEGAAYAVLEAVAGRGLVSVAIDTPSGVHGDTGQVLGTAVPAALTVTFFRAKPGHLLFPGRGLCGELVVADIGTPVGVLGPVAPRQWRNGPALWAGRWRRPGPTDHKYSRGHVLMAGGDVMTGAARLATAAARHVGAGMVTLAAPSRACTVYRTGDPGVIVRECDGEGEFVELLADRRRNAILVGPGLGVGEATRKLALAALATGRPTVLDADALTSFAGRSGELFAAVSGPCILTPHEGEFGRLFGDADVSEPDRLTRVRRAAKASGCTVLLKGADTVIVAPDGRAVINDNAPASLATAGTGDVLAGILTALLGQGLSALEAGAAGAWIHGAAADGVQAGLVAEDLVPAIAQVIRKL